MRPHAMLGQDMLESPRRAARGWALLKRREMSASRGHGRRRAKTATGGCFPGVPTNPACAGVGGVLRDPRPPPATENSAGKRPVTRTTEEGIRQPPRRTDSGMCVGITLAQPWAISSARESRSCPPRGPLEGRTPMRHFRRSSTTPVRRLLPREGDRTVRMDYSTSKSSSSALGGMDLICRVWLTCAAGVGARGLSSCEGLSTQPRSELRASGRGLSRSRRASRYAASARRRAQA